MTKGAAFSGVSRKKTASRGLLVFSEISFRQFPFHFNSECPGFSVELLAFRKLNDFPDLDLEIPYHLFPFQHVPNFRLNGNLKRKYLKLIQGALWLLVMTIWRDDCLILHLVLTICVMRTSNYRWTTLSRETKNSSKRWRLEISVQN